MLTASSPTRSFWLLLRAFVVAVAGLSLAACGRAALWDEYGLAADGGDAGDVGLDGGDGATDGEPDASPDGASDAPTDGLPDANVTLVVVDPAFATLPIGGIQAFTARAQFSTGAILDVTTAAAWTSTNPAVLTIDASGNAHAVTAGKARVEATFGGAVGTADVTVTGDPVVGLQVSPPSGSTAPGGTVAFTASAITKSGAVLDVTASAVWSSSDPTIATVATGVATGVGAGTASITAAFGGFSARAFLTVTGKTLAQVQISPFAPTLSVGASVALKATAVYTDLTTADVTSTSTWASSAPTIATVDFTGNATGVKAGSTIVSATFGGMTGTTPVTVTGATLLSLSINPAAATISPSTTVGLKATATYSDGTTVDVTASAAWTSSDTTVATASAGLVAGIAPGSATIDAAFGGMTGSATITVSPATLLLITITPANPSLPIGGTLSFKATGTYSGGATQDLTTSVTWSVGDSTIASVSNAPGQNGVATPLKVGTTSVQASLGGVTGSTTLTVTAATLQSIAITPSTLSLVQGAKQLVTAKGTYSDGSTLDVTTTCTWSRANAAVATVSNGAGSQGQLAAVGVGTTTISCTLAGVTGSATVTVTSPTLGSLAVSPIAPTCHVGNVLQFQAQAITTAGTTQNVTNAATWSSSDAAIVQPAGPPGRFRCVATGSATVSATYNGLSASTPVTVSGAVAVSLQVDPVDASLAVGATQQYQAVAIFSDGTSQNVTFQATWTSSDTTVAQIATGGPGPGGGGRGVAHALSPGATTITAQWNGLTGSTTLTVTSATVVSISVSPAARSVPAGTRIAYSAMAIYSDGTSRDVTNQATWTSSNPAVAQVSDGIGSKGQATAIAPGTTTLSATYQGVTGSATLTVTAATLVSVQVTCTPPTVPVGVPADCRAAALYSDSTSRDVTGAATWTSSTPSVAAVSDAAGSKGVVTSLAAGTTSINASFQGVAGQFSLTVTSATLQSIQLTPFQPRLPVGYGVRLVATAIFSDGTTMEVTSLATWTSSASGVAAVSDTAGSKGVVSALSPGSATIQASYLGVAGTDLVTVTSATLASIAITPNPASVPSSGTTQLAATGTFSDGSTLDVTTFVTWYSSNTSVADVSNAAGTKGLAYGFAPGTVTVTAVRSGVTGSASLTVN